jgi:hypothetical protein
MTSAPYSIDDAHSDVSHLEVLLDIALEMQIEIPVEEAAGRARAQRITALLWVARDLARTIDSSMEEHHADLCLRCRSVEE